MEGDDGSGTVRPAWAIDLRERLGRASGSNLKIKLWEEKENGIGSLDLTKLCFLTRLNYKMSKGKFCPLFVGVVQIPRRYRLGQTYGERI